MRPGHVAVCQRSIEGALDQAAELLPVQGTAQRDAETARLARQWLRVFDKWLSAQTLGNLSKLGLLRCGHELDTGADRARREDTFTQRPEHALSQLAYGCFVLRACRSEERRVGK